MIHTANCLNSFSMWLLLLGFQIITVECFSEIRIIREPKDFTGFMNRFQGFDTYSVTGDDITKYQWYHNGTIIPEAEPRGEIPEYFNPTKLNIRIFNPKLKHQGIYQLKIASKWGKIFGREIKVEYTIVGKFQNGETQSYDVVIGQPYRLACPSHGFTRHAIYKWGGHDVTQGTWFYPTGDNVIVLDDGTLFFAYVTEKDVERIRIKDGVRCLLDAIYQQDTRIEPSGAFLLRIAGHNKTVFGPVLEKIPDKEVETGNYAIFRCIAAGYPAPTYKWEKIDSQGHKRPVFNQVNGVELSEKNKWLTIEKIRKEHAGTYVCTATTNVNGTITTVQEKGELKVRAAPTWVIGSDIKSANPDIFSQHVWTCIAKGDPEPEYRWYANATIMINQSGRHTIEGGILTFHQLTLEDNGMYQCVAKNKYGFIYQTVAMNVKYQSPVITMFDEQTTLVVGQPGLIQCKSSAIPKAIHSWFYNDNKLDIAARTKYELRDESHLVINNLTKSDAGNYKCVATNMFGEATKSSAVGIGEIVFTTRLQDQSNVKKGETVTLSCEAKSDPPLSIWYKWRFQGESLRSDQRYLIAGSRQNTLLVMESKHWDSGQYECIAYINKPTYVERSSGAQVIIRGVPDPPENLTLQNTCSNFEANLSWIIPYKSTYDPLTSLQLQWSMANDNSTWYNVSEKVDVSSQSYVVSGLNPWSYLSFRLIAVNALGMSKPSEATDEKKCLTPGAKPTKCPDHVLGTATKPGVIEITWQNVPVKYRNGPSFNYILSYRRPGSTWKVETILPSPNPRYIITGAGIDKLWEFEVQSNNTLGSGPDCKIHASRSEKEAPSVAPQSFTYKAIGPTFVILKWKALKIVNNIILGYKITYWQTDSSPTIIRRATVVNQCDDQATPCEESVLGANTTEYKLENLLPYRAYTLQLQGYNSGGVGPKSNPLKLRTAEAKPGAPQIVKAKAYGKYIKLDWKAPKQPNGEILGYIVGIKSAEMTEPLKNHTTQTKHLFRNLEPKREYVVYIQAKTSAGSGDETAEVVSTTTIRAPAVSKAPDVHGLSKDSVNVTFNKGDGEGGFAEKFYVTYKEKGEDDKNLKRTNMTWIKTDGQKSHMVVSGLETGKKYLFATVVANGEERSGMSEFTEGHPVLRDAKARSTPWYKKYWFYLIIAIILLLILVILLVLLLRRKPKRTYKVSERERKHAPRNDDGYPLNPYEPDNEDPSQGKAYDFSQPIKEEPSGATVAPLPNQSPPRRSSERDSLDDYDGEDDDFSEHGSFIGQYGPGVKSGTSQSSLSNFV